MTTGNIIAVVSVAFILAGLGSSSAFAGNDIVRDKETGLEWVAGPDKDTNWNEAKSWVENLSVEGGGWRTPTIEELQTLYKKNVGTRNMTPELKTTGWGVWSGETKGSSMVVYFDFRNGKKYWRTRDFSPGFRAFAVRTQR